MSIFSASDISHKSGGRLSLLFVRPALTFPAVALLSDGFQSCGDRTVDYDIRQDTGQSSALNEFVSGCTIMLLRSQTTTTGVENRA